VETQESHRSSLGRYEISSQTSETSLRTMEESGPLRSRAR